MSDKDSVEAAPSVEIDGERHFLVDQERLAILSEALGESKLTELTLTARQSILESAGELRANWQTGDVHAAGRSAHRLVGVAANFGWPALAAVARVIERACHDGTDGRQHAPQFEEILAASLAALSISPAG
ncbi:Hpt domain-containing protein [Telmatospirillum siberiense]|uniref:HPt domain-containing protein n=1 Tax=Telmatospirillum siberiense TaxID=382514 RepID=A0A2N3PWK8_9PROT|nr:Hpt domain-containing protein [Telmatospirillum siberiense]PKU24771.1 hypothetical protein CWS72_09225 [Telmatospirillum siberiense]